jgi:predicted PurR-regulated permease PerM
MNAIKQLLAYILSLPSVLLQYFKDCIKLLQSQLVSSYKSALNEGAGATDSQINELNAAMKDITNSVNEFTKSVGTLAATAGTAVLSLVSPGQFETGNTQMQNEATSTVFSAAGFSYTPSSGARP